MAFITAHFTRVRWVHQQTPIIRFVCAEKSRFGLFTWSTQLFSDVFHFFGRYFNIRPFSAPICSPRTKSVQLPFWNPLQFVRPFAESADTFSPLSLFALSFLLSRHIPWSHLGVFGGSWRMRRATVYFRDSRKECLLNVRANAQWHENGIFFGKIVKIFQIYLPNYLYWTHEM